MVDLLIRLNTLHLRALSPRVRHLANLAAVIALLGFGTLTVYNTGGTAYVYPYLMLIPVAAAAALYGLIGGLLSALAAGLLMGPLMPLETLTGEMQPLSNWLIRLGLYLALGAFIGAIFGGIRTIRQRHEDDLRLDVRTGLANSSAMDDDLALALARLGRSRWGHSLQGEQVTAIQLSFVRFPDLSDILETLGPQAADDALSTVTAAIQRECGRHTSVYRFSVSEIVLLQRQRNVVDPKAVIDAILKATEQVFEVHSVPVQLTAEIGSYQVKAPDIDARTMIQRARLALNSTHEHHAPYSIYSADHEARMNSLIRVITGVRKGLDAGEFDLHFQPKINLADGRPAGSEALIRWVNQHGEMIPPGQFMPKVESTSLIQPVTRFVIDRACQHLQGHPERHLSINFSSRNLLDESLVKSLPDWLREYNINTSQLEIEITEGALINQPDRARMIIQELRHQGFAISIDDFGTGYSSFDYLARLPVTGLKIDRAFVSRLSKGEANADILRSMIALGTALDLEITLEGVETRTEYDALVQMGGHQAQGFYFARPMPAEQYGAWEKQPVFAGHQDTIGG